MQDSTENSAAYKNLDYIVNSVLNEIGDYTTTQYQRLLQLGVEGVRELNLYDYPCIRVKYLTVNDNFTLDYPDDYVEYTKIGLCRGGQVITLSRNQDLCLPRKTDDCGQITSIDAQTQIDENLALNNNFGIGIGDIGFGFQFASHFRNGQYVGELYGIGGGLNRAYYRDDKEKRQIAFSGTLTQDEQVVLEYKSSGVNNDGSAVVPVDGIEPVKRWIHWKRMEYDKRVSLSEKARREQLYYLAVTKFRAFQQSFTMSEYLDSTYRTYKSGPKR